MIEKGPKPIEKREFINTGREVVVTGFGAITPLGPNAEIMWQNMQAGQSGVIEYDTGHPDIRVAAPIKDGDFDPLNFFERKELRRVHRTAQLTTAATQEALEKAGFIVDGQSKFSQRGLERTGIVIGTCVGGMYTILDTHHTIEKKGPKQVGITSVLKALSDRPGDVASIRWGFKGPMRGAANTACATGNTAMIEAADLISLGRADIVVTGGVESVLIPEAFAWFAEALAGGYVSDGQLMPEKSSRPFDQEAAGFVIGEGAVIFILENYQHAKARGATIYARVVGSGETGDAYHETAPSGEGAERAMRLALEEAKMKPADLDLIFAHATSTATGDPSERDAIRRVLGQTARKVSVVGVKSEVGHLLGAAGSISQLAAILAIRDGIIPPTINLDYPIENVSTDQSVYDGEEPPLYVPNTVVKRKIERVMINTSGLGGKNAMLILEKVD